MSTDKYGRQLSAYPARSDIGTLLGINAYGTAVYATDDTVSLAVLDERGDLRTPPRTYWSSHDFPLDELDMSRGQYVLYAVQNHGPWRAVTDDVADLLAANDVDVDGVVATDSTDLSSVEALASALLAAEDWEDRASHANELRLAVMDAPDVPDLLSSLLPLLDDVDGERERIEAEADDPTGSQPYDERTRNFDRIAVRRDVAYTVARITRATTDAVESLFDEVVHVAGDDTYHDPDTAYKHHLVDVLDVVGRSNTADMARKLSSLLESDDASTRERTLSALYQLEREYVTGDHPLLESPSIREAVAAAEDDDVEAVRRAALDIELIHDFDES